MTLSLWHHTATIAFDLPEGSVYPLTKMEQPKLLIAGQRVATERALPVINPHAGLRRLHRRRKTTYASLQTQWRDFARPCQPLPEASWLTFTARRQHGRGGSVNGGRMMDPPVSSFAVLVSWWFNIGFGTARPVD